MEALIVIAIVILGLVFGSFLNVCIARLPRHESIVRPRSRCPRCGGAIAAWDNIPVLSYMLLGGRCRACRNPISWRYPAIELLLPILWLLCWVEFGLTIRGVGMAVLCFLLLGLAVMDAETMRLPDAFTLPGIVLGIVYSGAICDKWAHCAALSLGWAATFAGLMLAIAGIYWLLRRRAGMGIGDAKLMALVAAWLGPSQGALVLFLGVVVAAIYALVLSAARRRMEGSVALPFGAFLSVAGIYALFVGQRIIYWYLGFFR
jgi:leader peptidase (prepilin peptidase) / N-methyltransferase